MHATPICDKCNNPGVDKIFQLNVSRVYDDDVETIMHVDPHRVDPLRIYQVGSSTGWSKTDSRIVEVRLCKNCIRRGRLIEWLPFCLVLMAGLLAAIIFLMRDDGIWAILFLGLTLLIFSVPFFQKDTISAWSTAKRTYERKILRDQPHARVYTGDLPTFTRPLNRSYHIQAKAVIAFSDGDVQQSRSAEIQLRKISRELSFDEARQMLIKFGFFDKLKNWNGRGIHHTYSPIKGDDSHTVFDTTTGLMWQQSGSDSRMDYNDAKEWIEELNRKEYAGYTDWRLPTLEEAMSLMEPEKKNHHLYIDSLFDKNQEYIWTSDQFKGNPWPWIVEFHSGESCHYYAFNNTIYVRAVRSEISHTLNPTQYSTNVATEVKEVPKYVNKSTERN